MSINEPPPSPALLGIIYCATSRTSGKSYVGQHVTQSLNRRKGQHKRSFGRFVRLGESSHPKLHEAIAAYGWDDFEWRVLEGNIRHDLLNEREKYWVLCLNSYRDGYNCTPGGECLSQTPEVRAKISAAVSGEKNGFFGRKHSSESKAKISASWDGESGERHRAALSVSWTDERKAKIPRGKDSPMWGRRAPAEVRKKMSESQSRRPPATEETLAKIRSRWTEDKRAAHGAARSGPLNPRYGKPVSEETRSKIGEANRGRVHTEETRAKISAATTGEKNPNFGKKHSEETLRKISLALKGRVSPWRGKKLPDEVRRKLSESRSLLTPEQARVALGRLANGERGCDLAAEYGVSKQCISKLKKRRFI